ncbi:MAG: hypothetical protein C0603_08485 [Denitrovibrio sp.]|mgnify:CR=1 FL=1|nr:MAG: hypothetical protein C0603_08485 [Denitrovibrio sp.]
MNLLKNYTSKNEAELAKLFDKRYGLDLNEFIFSRDDSGRIIVKVVSEESVDADAEMVISSDGLKASINLFPAINDGKVLTSNRVMEFLQEDNITVNIHRDAIDNAVSLCNEGGISEGIVIAEGVEPIHGKNSQIILNFDPLKNKPKILRNGRVDYKNVDNIRTVNEGDLLLTLKPATSGVRGLSIRNEEIPAIAGVDTSISFGEGVREEKEGTEYYATTDGCVSFARNTLEVNPVYVVRGNVDYTSGNITFNGSVHVKNDVLSDFTIKAEKDIFIEGLCQDAHLEAGGNIIIKLGVKGDLKGSIKAKGDVTIGYAEGAKIETKGNIEIQKYAYSSILKAGGKIEALKEPGVIAGGTLVAFSEVRMLQAGTTGNSKFLINVGTKYYFAEEMDALKTSQLKLEESKGKIDEFLGSVNLKSKEVLANPKVRQLITMRKQIDKKVADVDEKMKKLIKEAHHPKPKLKVTGELFGGLDVQIYREKVTVRENQKNVVYFFEDKYQQIKFVSLEDKDWQE